MLRNPRITVSAILLILLMQAVSCNKNKNEEEGKIFELTDAEKTGLKFVNTVPENDTINQFTYHYLFNGNGVATGDLNNDGLPEVIFTGNEVPAKVFLNKGDFTFEDVTVKSGLKTQYWMSGIALGDVNNDGFLDIYICRSGPLDKPERKANLLFINNGNMTFTEKAAEWGVNDPGNATCATFFDMDNDGDLDMYLGNHATKFYADVNTPFTRKLHMDENNQQHLFRNDGNKYTDVSEQAGVKAMGYCLSASAADFNRDGLTDLYICNDYHVPDYYFINNGDGTFTESFDKYFKHSSNNSMGADVADYNDDGWLDLITLDMLPEDPRRFSLLAGPKKLNFFQTAVNNNYGYQYMKNALQTNMGKGYFSDLAYLAGVARTDWSWSPLFADLDNDGLTDLFITNGYYRDVTNMDFMMFQKRKMEQAKQDVTQKEILEKLPFEKLSNYALKNTGNLSFTNTTSQWGLEEPTLSTGSAIADLDNDGHLDIIICNQGDNAHVYKNIAKKGNYLNVSCKGGKKNNRFGYGCKLLVHRDTGYKLMEMQPARGYQSSSEPVFHVGLGESNSVKKLILVWPNGEFQEMTDVKANQNIVMEEGKATGKWVFNDKNEVLFENITDESGLDFIHEESDDPDFKREPLLPHRFSMMGPGAASGDINGDGLADVLVTNSRTSKGTRLFIQSAEGNFKTASSQPWSAMSTVDVLGCLIFDADTDGDNDIYLAAGGNEYGWPTEKYQHRLYINDGKGNFSEKKDALTGVNSSASCITAGDIDGDGDLDLFVAGRINPGKYPDMHIRSYILRNDGGTFTDITKFVAPDLIQPGMICAAVFADYNTDGKTDLILAGEWMPIVFMQNTGEKFINQTGEAGTAGIAGWYNSLLTVDIDNDGDLDVIAGNKGNNSYFNATPESEIKIFWADFDNNGRDDIVMSQNKGGKEYPLYQLDEMGEAYPQFINKRFTTFTEFAGKTLDVIVGAENLTKNGLKATEFSSLVLRNNGGQFSIEKLPRGAQAAPIFGLTAADIDGNGFMDIIGIGNSFAPRVQHGRDDAFNGFVLMNKGGNLTYSNGVMNGFYVPGDAKSLITVPVAGKGICLVATQNNGKTMLFSSLNKGQEFVAAPVRARHAIVSLKNGSKRYENMLLGHGYISASQPGVWKNDAVKAVEFYDVGGKKL